MYTPSQSKEIVLIRQYGEDERGFNRKHRVNALFSLELHCRTWQVVEDEIMASTINWRLFLSDVIGNGDLHIGQ